MSYHIEMRGRASQRPRIQPMGDDGAFLLSVPAPTVMFPLTHTLGDTTLIPVTPSAATLTEEQKAVLKAILGVIAAIALAWFAMSAFKKKQVVANVRRRLRSNGAQEFYVIAKGATAADAFRKAVDEAQHEYGHDRYSGTIGGKRDFAMVPPPPKGTDARAYAQGLVEADQQLDFAKRRISDKWGPAGCIPLGKGEWLFFGLAPS